jgi:hypothetical protein
MEETVQTSQKFARIGGVTALALLLYVLVTLAVVFGLGGQPASAREILDLLHTNRLVGILRLDALTTLAMPLYYLLFLSLYLALRKDQPVAATLSLLLGCAGLTLFLSAPSFFSWLTLSDKFAAATEASQKTLLLAAGEGVLATDLWHGSSAFLGGLLVQVALLMISLAMLSSSLFRKSTAWVGVVTHGLDLAHVLVLPFLPAVAAVLMAIGGTLYLPWFPLLAGDFFRQGRKSGD